MSSSIYGFSDDSSSSYDDSPSSDEEEEPEYDTPEEYVEPKLPPKQSGVVFMRGYYYYMKFAPSCRPQFYEDHSLIGRPNSYYYKTIKDDDSNSYTTTTTGYSMSITTTMESINTKAHALNAFVDKARIITLDTQESCHGCISILITASYPISSKTANSIRRYFAHSVFLVPSCPNKYFVLNDILRFVPDDDSYIHEKISSKPPPPNVEEDEPPFSSAQLVGQSFIRYYYQILQTSPITAASLFYKDISNLSRPDDHQQAANESMTNATTLKAIQEKIHSFYKDFKAAEIKTVDAHSSYNGGINVLVTGVYLTGKNNTISRNFAQSILLRPQEEDHNKGSYFVLNDIFRYVDNDNSNPVLFNPNYIISKMMKPQIPNLPEEIIEEILARVPVKCLLNMKYVSKQWCSLIRNKKDYKWKIAKEIFDQLRKDYETSLKVYGNRTEEWLTNIKEQKMAYIEEKSRVKLQKAMFGYEVVHGPHSHIELYVAYKNSKIEIEHRISNMKKELERKNHKLIRMETRVQFYKELGL